MNVTIFNSGAGNLHSIAKALSSFDNTDVRVEEDPQSLLKKSDLIVLPGVGAFGYAIEALAPIRSELNELANEGFPVIGICLGMQLLFDESEEGTGNGLGIINGNVTKLNAQRIPHMGWNTLEATTPDFIDFDAAPMYFANSYVCRPANDDEVKAYTVHESDKFPSIVRKNNVVGFQFHPEKSSNVGISLLNCAVKAVTK